jgi:hypothetical protein
MAPTPGSSLTEKMRILAVARVRPDNSFQPTSSSSLRSSALKLSRERTSEPLILKSCLQHLAQGLSSYSML